MSVKRYAWRMIRGLLKTQNSFLAPPFWAGKTNGKTPMTSKLTQLMNMHRPRSPVTLQPMSIELLLGGGAYEGLRIRTILVLAAKPKRIFEKTALEKR